MPVWKEKVDQTMSKCAVPGAALLGGAAAIAAAFLAGSILLSGLPSREELQGPEETTELEETLSPEERDRLNGRYGLETPAPREPSYLELLLQADWGISLKPGNKTKESVIQ